MADTPKKRALVVRSFNVAGTNQRFQKGATPLIDAGAFANYEAAGLVTAAPAAKAAQTVKSASTKGKATSKPKASRKAAGASPAPAPAPATTDGAAAN